jgi:hypothetical protein
MGEHAPPTIGPIPQELASRTASAKCPLDAPTNRCYMVATSRADPIGVPYRGGDVRAQTERVVRLGSGAGVGRAQWLQAPG